MGWCLIWIQDIFTSIYRDAIHTYKNAWIFVTTEVTDVQTKLEAEQKMGFSIESNKNFMWLRGIPELSQSLYITFKNIILTCKNNSYLCDSYYYWDFYITILCFLLLCNHHETFIHLKLHVFSLSISLTIKWRRRKGYYLLFSTVPACKMLYHVK